MKNLGGKTILRNISFNVEQGEIFVVNGPSGSGKSTLLRCLNRLIEPDGGEIIFNGVNILDMDVLELRRLMGFVPQIPVMFEGSVRDNLLFSPNFHGLNVNEKELRDLMEMVGLPVSYLDKAAHELSVGEQQRVSIARTLINNPKLILMDEPTSHLDPENTLLIEDLIKRFNSKLGMSFIIVSHSPEQSHRIGHKIAFLENGTIVKVEVNT